MSLATLPYSYILKQQEFLSSHFHDVHIERLHKSYFFATNDETLINIRSAAALLRISTLNFVQTDTKLRELRISNCFLKIN